MTDQAAFQLEVDQNQYLPSGSDTVNAVVTVTASGAGLRAGASAPTAAQVIMVDCSGSMGYPITKLNEAKKATAVAVDTLRDGVAFAVVSGRTTAQMVYPPQPGMVPADPRTRAEAKAAVGRLIADGGTAIGSWLTLADQLLASVPAEVKHAIMLTDGRNQHESRDELNRVLAACQGRFVCDSRGVGDDWVGEELRAVASALLGTADGLEDPGELPEAFRSMTEAAMGKAVAHVSLRLWAPAGAEIQFVKQVFPQVEDLTTRRVDVSPRISEYPTGAWGAESRDYHVSVRVRPGAVGEEMLAARISLVGNDEVLGQALALANWTDDSALSTKINPKVAHYTGQAELASAIQQGLAARDAGDLETATAKLGRAVQLATESGHSDTAKLLSRVVDVVDAPSGTVQLKKKVSNVDAELADVRSVKTIRVKKSQPSES
jgi:hypothetical protein